MSSIYFDNGYIIVTDVGKATEIKKWFTNYKGEGLNVI